MRNEQMWGKRKNTSNPARASVYDVELVSIEYVLGQPRVRWQDDNGFIRSARLTETALEDLMGGKPGDRVTLIRNGYGHVLKADLRTNVTEDVGS